MKNMKNIKFLLTVFLTLSLVFSCEDDEATFGEITTPTNLEVTVDIVGQDTNNPNGDGSGVVNMTATSKNGISYRYVYNGIQLNAPNGSAELNFNTLGLNTYLVTVIAYGTGGNSTSTTISLEVLFTYEPPADLLNTLVGDGSKTWRIKSESPGHFGLGPVGGLIPTEWYGAGPGEKAATGMYDDRYVFNADGTFTHIVSSANDDPVEDTTGTVFGRVGLIDELGPHSEVANGSDIENYPYNDYNANWSLTAPGGVETLNLTGLAFMGYYTSGNHKYEIFDRSSPNEFILKTTDGNNEFDWWFIITSEEEGSSEFETQYNTLIWSDEFDSNGAPDNAKWTYDLGAGGWGNEELQTYTNNAENVIIEDGFLKITAKDNGTGYTSARLKSENLFEFTYGRVEVRAKLPASIGTWPAIWMLGEDYQTNTWPGCGEIDIMEQTGQDKNRVIGTVHHPAVSPGAGDSAETFLNTSTSQFHNYTVEWRSGTILILVDDTVYHTINNTPDLPFDSDFFLILNVAMGGTLGGDVDPAFTEDSMEIDYVRVYQ